MLQLKWCTPTKASNEMTATFAVRLDPECASGPRYWMDYGQPGSNRDGKPA